MKAGIRTKLFLVSLTPIVITVASFEIYMARSVERAMVGRIRDDLFVSAGLVERSAARIDGAASMSLAPGAPWQQLAAELGEAAHVRVTLIAPDGRVVADSDEDETSLRTMDNHATRPEVATALAGGRGYSVRWSATLGMRMMYVALPMRVEGQIAGVVRIAEAIKDVDVAVASARRALGVGMVVAILIAILMSTGAAHLMSRAVRHLTGAARQMAGGDLAVRTRMEGRDELAELGRALDRLAEGQASSLAELRAERDRVSRILEGMQEGVLLLDASNRVLLVNPALRSMLLLGPDVAGRHLMELVRNAELQQVLDRAATAEGPSSGELEIGGLKPRRLVVHASPLPGEPHGLLVVFVDVTDMRRLEAMRRDFVANASHELRTPIAAVRSASETLRDAVERDPKAAVRFVDMVQRNAERLGALVDDLLELSRIESRDVKPRRDTIELGPAVDRAVAEVQERATRKRMKLATDLPPSWTICADARGLEHVLINLLDNAVKYCPEGASITVRARIESGQVRIEVRDTGPGIEARHLPRLFERFYRVDPGRSREMGGTGLGLSIVKHLVEAMGGRVGVDSTPGSGSTFWFALPKA